MKNLILNSLLLSFLFSCVGQMAPLPQLQIRGNYKFEFYAQSMGKDWPLATTNEKNKGIVFLNLSDIYSNVDLFIKISKPSGNLIGGDNEIEVNLTQADKALDESLFFVDYSDCNGKIMLVGSSCTIHVIAKYKEEGTQLGLLDGLDLAVIEKVRTSYEEPLKVNISVDMHRKVMSSVTKLFKDDINFGELNFYASSSKNFDLLKIDGEFNYEIIPSISSLNDEFEVDSKDRTGLINVDVSIKGNIPGKAMSGGDKNTTLDFIVKFENGKEEKISFPIKAKKRSAPQISFISTDDNFQFKKEDYVKTIELKNIGGSYLEISKLNLDDNLNFKLIKNECLVSLNKNASCEIQIKYTPENLAKAYNGLIKVEAVSDKYPISVVKTILGGISDPAFLEAYIDDKKESSYDFGNILKGKSASVEVFLKNTKALNAEIKTSDISIIENANGAFSFVMEDKCSILPQNETCKITVNFNPSQVATYNITKLRIKYTDVVNTGGSPASPLEIELKAVVKDLANLALVNPISDFGVVLKGASGTCDMGTTCRADYYKEKIQTVSIKNTGDWDASNVVVSGVGEHKTLFSFSSPTDNNFATTYTCQNLAKNATCSFKFKFNSELYTGITNGVSIWDSLDSNKIKITYSNGEINDKVLDSKIKGKVFLPGTLLTTFSSKDFGTKLISENQTQTLTLKNTNSPSNLIHFADIKILNDDVNKFIFDANSNHWSVSENNCSNVKLAINKTCTLKIKFAPSGAITYGVDSMSFPYTGIKEEHVVKALNTNFKFNYTRFLDANLDTLPDLVSSSSAITAKVGKNAELVITEVSTASRKSLDPTNDNYNWFTRGLTGLTTEGSVASVVGEPNNKGTWNFDKTFLLNEISEAALQIKFLNIGYEKAAKVKPLRSNESNFRIYSNLTFCSEINGVSSSICDLSFFPTVEGENTATLTSFQYQSGNNLVTRNIAYSKSSPSATASVNLKGFGIRNPSLSLFQWDLLSSSYKAVNASNDYNIGSLLFGLGEYNNEITHKFKIVVGQTNQINENYKQNINVDGTNYSYIPVTLKAFSFLSNNNPYKFVKEARDIDGNIVTSFDSSIYFTGGEKEYSLKFGLTDNNLSLDTVYTYSDTNFLCKDVYSYASYLNGNWGHQTSVPNFNIYSNSSKNFPKHIRFFYKSLPALSLENGNNYCNYQFNKTADTSSTVVSIKNNSNYNVTNVFPETLDTCTSGSITLDNKMFEVLFNGNKSSIDSSFTCNIPSEACLRSDLNPDFVLGIGETCKVCLYYKKSGAVAQGYDSLSQDVDISYTVQLASTVFENKVTNLFLENKFPASLFKDNGKYSISTDDISYSNYTSGGICGTSQISESSSFYIKSILKNVGSKGLIFSGASQIYYYAIPSSIRNAVRVSPSDSFSYTGMPFSIQAISLNCNGNNGLATSDFVIPNNGTCELVYKLSTNTTHLIVNENGTLSPVNDLFSDLCSAYPTLNFSSYFYYNSKNKINDIRHILCKDELSSTSQKGFYIVGNSNTGL